MNLTPLLLTSRIPKLVRPPMSPDILRNLLPRYLRRLLQSGAGGISISERRVGMGRWRWGAGQDAFAEELDLFEQEGCQLADRFDSGACFVKRREVDCGTWGWEDAYISF